MKNPAIIIVTAALLANALEAQDLPDGFTHDVVMSDVHLACALAFLPDGRLLVTEEDHGDIRVHADGSVGTLGTVPSVAYPSERGLTGLAVDPLWPAWPYIYVFYNDALTTSIRISRFTVTGDLNDPLSTNLSIGSQYDLLAGVPDNHPWHNGGTLRFGPDGYLYASLGDDFVPCDSQDPTHLSGCLLRMDIAPVRGAAGAGPPTSSLLIAPGNPWTGANAELMWAIGLRQPFRFTVDEMTGDVFIADVGSWQWEEVNQCPTAGPGGMNFGWPEREGTHPSAWPTCGSTAVFSDPIVEYDHTLPGGQAVILLAGTYRNRAGGAYNFGTDYEGDILISDYRQGWIRRYTWNGTSWAIAAAVAGQPTATEWATGLTQIVDGVVGPDGDLYYTSRSLRIVGRIRNGTGPASELSLTAAQPGGPGGAVTVQNTHLVTGSEYFNLFSLEHCTAGVGQGPYLGLCSTTPVVLWNQFYSPIGTPPVHFIAAAPTMTWGPYAVPPGVVEGVTFEWANGALARVSRVTRVLVQ